MRNEKLKKTGQLRKVRVEFGFGTVCLMMNRMIKMIDWVIMIMIIIAITIMSMNAIRKMGLWFLDQQSHSGSLWLYDSLSGSLCISLALSLSFSLWLSLAPIADGGMVKLIVVCEHCHLDLLDKTTVPQPSWPSTVGVGSFLLRYQTLYHIAPTSSYSS